LYGNQLETLKDFDGDNIPEIAVAHRGYPPNSFGDWGSVFVQYINSDGTSKKRTTLDVGPVSYFNSGTYYPLDMRAIWDDSFDVNPSILTTSYYRPFWNGRPSETFYLLEINEDGTLNKRTMDTLVRSAPQKSVGDIDEDGIEDFLVFAPGSVMFKTMNSDGTTKDEYELPNLGEWRFGLDVEFLGDIDGDGKIDIAVLEGGGKDYCLPWVFPFPNCISYTSYNKLHIILSNVSSDKIVQNCLNSCPTPGANQCNMDGIPQMCESVSGCLKWVDQTSCEADQVCNGGSCSCNDECVLGDPVACNVDGIPQECEETANGCFRLKDLAPDCPSDGAGQCDVDGLPQLCEISSVDGCLAWESQPACEVGSPCVNGFCSCTDECVLAATQCNSEGIPQLCEDTGACLKWVDQTPACPGLGAKQCNVSQPQECLIDSVLGCLAWEDLGLACADPKPFCSAGFCIPPQTTFDLRVFPIPLPQGDQLTTKLEITSNVLMNDLSVNVKIIDFLNSGEELNNLTKQARVDPTISSVETVIFDGGDLDFDTTHIPSGNYSLTVKVTDNETGEIIYTEKIFISVIEATQPISVPELNPVIVILLVLTVFYFLTSNK
jgi:hypothetical protein